MYVQILLEFLRSLAGVRLEASFAGFPIGHVGVHEAFEDSAVVRYEQVDEFVDDDELA